MGQSFTSDNKPIATLSAKAKGLVAHWPMDEGSGDVAADLSSNGHDMH